MVWRRGKRKLKENIRPGMRERKDRKGRELVGVGGRGREGRQRPHVEKKVCGGGCLRRTQPTLPQPLFLCVPPASLLFFSLSPCHPPSPSPGRVRLWGKFIFKFSSFLFHFPSPASRMRKKKKREGKKRKSSLKRPDSWLRLGRGRGGGENRLRCLSLWESKGRVGEGTERGVRAFKMKCSISSLPTLLPFALNPIPPLFSSVPPNKRSRAGGRGEKNSPAKKMKGGKWCSIVLT